MKNNTLAIIVAFYLSKFDKMGLNNLKFNSFNDAFEVCANLLNVKRNYIKLRRDEFDPVFPWRQGWKRPMDKRIIRAIEILDELDEVDLREIVENILHNPSYRENEELNEIVAIIKNTKDKKVELGKFILRGPTGRAAEEFFYDQYIQNNISLLPNGVLEDCRDLGCGYDYKLIDGKSNEYYIEVKGLSNNSGGILFTNKEWKTAKEKKDKYYLCIIRDLNNNPGIELINNPYKILAPKKHIKPSIQINWSVSEKDLLAIPLVKN